MNSLRAYRKLVWTEMKLYLREPIAMFFTLGFPLMMLFLFGGVYGNQPAALFGGRGTVDVSVPSWAAMIIGTTGLMSLVPLIAGYRERGILRRFSTTPLSPLTYVAAQVSVLFTMTVSGMVLLIVAAKLVYNLRFSGNPLSVAAAFVLASFSFFAFGLLLSGILPTYRTASAVSMVIFYPMLFLSGAGMPRELLPDAMKRIGDAFPMTYAVTLLKGLWFGEPWAKFGREVAVLAGTLVISLALSSRWFNWNGREG
ncbi:MAG: ABC transporter permease [Bacillota bacterium]